MSRFHALQFSAGIDLSGRNLKIRDLSTVPPTTLVDTNLAGSTDSWEGELPANKMLEAVLTDTRDSVAFVPTVFKFNTWDGNAFGQSGSIVHLSSEEASSSSSTSSLSSSSSSSSSTSSSSLSSLSSSSTSSSSLSSLSSSSSS